MKLFTVGPVACRPEILEEMRRQMFSHRSKEYKELHMELVKRLQDFLETENQVFLFPSSGSGVMETSVRNCVKEKMLCCVNGTFGERYAQVGESNGREVVRLETKLGEPTTPELLDEKLSENPDVEAVTITHNETSVGLMNPLPELAKVVSDHEKLLFVDAVSAMGGTPIKVDEWGIDICFASSQKCFGVPPGLAVASVSEEAMSQSGKLENKGWYFDLKLYEEYEEKKSGTHMTPPIPQILALNKRLELMDEDGKENHFELYLERNQKIREGVEDLGLSLFPKEGYESPTVTCVNAPEGVSGPEVYEKMRGKGFELAKGYGEIKERTFRIGNMGHILLEDIDEMLKALGEVLK
ncbi:aspartate aminotransferase [candidate division MSBL1 archaeon SCGC-AAA261O19]|uniref:Aspartate aminotransferase n=1 Tax=candidate division MSBL1 archaeon SCGC-AAA261O19 TaxID=1698277 RepID=A0A133VDB4_9EURY|nr:aspartate aminotransferase [candidate division MSBL1 archaeon SCGC-AAA261O19]